MDHNDGPTPTAHPAPRIPELPLEVLSNIASLLAPPFYPPDPITGHDLVHHLDPAPQPSLTHINQIALVCRSAHALLEPSRPWLWEHLDIRSGRGWLAVVNALTEEIMDDDGDDESPDRDRAGESSIIARTPGAVKQERAANTAAKVAAAMQGLAVTNMNGGPSAPSILSPTASTAPSTGVPYAADGYFTAEPPLETYPGLPEASSSLMASTSANTASASTTRGSVPAPIGIPISPPVYTTSQQQAIYSYSPPQPERVSLLLTPTVSRDPSASSSGSVSIMRDPNAIRSSSIILPPKASPGLGSASGSGASRLRGRSRSPRRSIGFITEGIEAVLQRSRSTSSHHQPQQQLHQQHRPDLSSPANAYSAWGRRPSLAFDGRPSFGRATSLSWSRTYADLSDGEADGDDAAGGDDADGDYAGGSGFEPSALNPISILDKGKGKASPFGFDYDITDQDGAETLFDRMGDPIFRARSTSPSARSVIEPMERHVSPPMPSHDSLLMGVDSEEHTMMEDEHWLNCNPELLPPPGPYIRHLSFTNFRTIGSRRTQDEAVRGRFVTAGRLEGVIKNAPNLVSVCMTEYVDSALSYEVVEELFFRGTKRPRRARRMSENRGLSLSRIRSMSVPSSPQNHIDQLDPPRPTYAPYEDETEDEKWKRRGMFTPLEALDLTGCISVTFQHAIDEFWHTFYAPDEGVHEGDEDDDENRGRSRSRSTRRGVVPGSMTGSESAGMVSATDTEAETEDESRAGSSAGLNGYFSGAGRRMSSRRRAPVFSGLKRLSLRNCLHIESHILDGLLRSFPCLTHLDLSGTKVPSRFLASLIDKAPRTLRLESLSLARCPRIDPHVVVEFLCRSPAAKDLKELNLFVNPSQGNPIRGDDLMRLITTAPCFRSGKLRYLDISSSHLSAAHLALGVFPPQPELICLGLSHMPSLNLEPISDFILNQAPNVEILTIVGTAFEHNLRPTHSALQLTLQLHSKLINPCTAEPFSLSLSLRPLDPNLPKDPGPTRLRVIELASWIRKAIGPAGGSHMWKNIRSKGGRGWYVDITAAWVQDTTEEGKKWRYARYLPHIHPWRMFLQGLSDAGGRVSSSVGWHSRKMEVIQGWGMMGREEGLAGAGAFAYEDQ